MAKLSEESVHAIFQLPAPDGSLEGPVRAHLRALGRRKPAVILAFPPKAAGTFLRAAVIRAVGSRLQRVVHAQGGRDAQLYLPFLIAHFSEQDPRMPVLVSHVHMQALAANIHMIEAFDIHPVIMMRSIPDMLASYCDMLDTDPVARADGLNCKIPDDFTTMTRATRMEFMVDIMGPWYASYYATWAAYAKSDPDRVCVLHYVDFKNDPADTVEAALEHAGIQRSRVDCQVALEAVSAIRGQLRYNKGERGRGHDYLSAGQIARLERMLGHYKNLAPHMDELLGRGAFAIGNAA